MAVIKYKNSEGNLVELPAIINYKPKTAYDLAVECGFSGTIEEWLESLKGSLSKENIENVLVGDIGSHTHQANIILQNSSNRFVTDNEKEIWNAKSNFNGDYNNLTNKPTIPSEYVLPTATDTVLGGIKVGAGLSITSGVLSTTGGGVADSVEWSNVQNKPNVATQDYVNTNINSLQKLQVSQTEPTDTSVKLWIDDSQNVTTTLAILNDSLESSDNVWSSSKTMRSVNDVETRLTNIINTHTHPNRLVTIDIVDTILTLTTDRYQTTTMITGTTIVLPTVTSFTEIYLFFKADSDLTLALPSCKWQTTPTIKSGKYYELVFTYTTEWIGGVIVYG